MIDDVTDSKIKENQMDGMGRLGWEGFSFNFHFIRLKLCMVKFLQKVKPKPIFNILTIRSLLGPKRGHKPLQ